MQSSHGHMALRGSVAALLLTAFLSFAATVPATGEQCPGLAKLTPAGVPGSALRNAGEVRSFRALLQCVSTKGRWVEDLRPRSLPWRHRHQVPPYETCDRRHEASVSGGVSGEAADKLAREQAPAAKWKVRPGLKFVWRVGAKSCGLKEDLVLDLGKFDQSGFCHMMLGNSSAPGATSKSEARPRRQMLLVGDSLQSTLAVSLLAFMEMGRPLSAPGEAGTPLWDLPCTANTRNYTLSRQLQYCFGRRLCGGQGSLDVQFVRSDHLLTIHRRYSNRQYQHHPWISLVRDATAAARPAARRRARSLAAVLPEDVRHTVQSNTGKVGEPAPDLAPIVVLNAGAHFVEDGEFFQQLCRTLTEVRRRCPSCLIIFRNTAPYHGGCSKAALPYGPGKVPPMDPALEEKFHWKSILRQTEYAQKLVEAAGGVYLDVLSMTRLRGDDHVGDEPKKRIPDCLHYCAPGPHDHWTLLLTFALKHLISK